MAIVYALCDPRETDATKRVRYIGVTNRSLAWRLRGHIAEATSDKVRKSHRTNWIRSLLRAGVRPTIEAVERIDGSGFEREQQVIAGFRAAGYSLVNSTDGGEGTLGYRPTNAARAKLGAASRRAWATPESRERLLAGVRRGAASPNRSANVSAAHSGVPHSEETRRRQSDGVRKAWASVGIEARRERLTPALERAHTPEARAKIAQTLRGHVGWKHTAETRAKISAANKGKARSAETKRRLSEALRNPSMERRANLSDAARIRWANGHGAAMCEAARQRWAEMDQSAREEKMRALNMKAHTPEARAKRSESLRRTWREKRERLAAREVEHAA